MTKYKCMVCQPSCMLEVRGYKITEALPSGCTFPENRFSPEWQIIGAKKAKKVAKKSAKRTHITTVSHKDTLKTLLGF